MRTARLKCSSERALVVIKMLPYYICLGTIFVDAFSMQVLKQMQPSTSSYASMLRFNTPRRHRTVLQMITPQIKDVNGGTEKIINGSFELEVDLTTASLEDAAAATSTDRLASQGINAKRTLPSNWLGEKGYILSTAALIGLTTGTNIAVFKKAVECVREILYGDGIEIPSWIYELFGGAAYADEHFLRLSETIPVALAPAVGGLLVGILLKVGGDLPPGLRDTVTEGMCI